MAIAHKKGNVGNHNVMASPTLGLPPAGLRGTQEVILSWVGLSAEPHSPIWQLHHNRTTVQQQLPVSLPGDPTKIHLNLESGSMTFRRQSVNRRASLTGLFMMEKYALLGMSSMKHMMSQIQYHLMLQHHLAQKGALQHRPLLNLEQ